MKKSLKLSILLTSCTTLFCSCGITRATIRNPREGATTEIRITTNNPITTTVDPNTNVEFKNKNNNE